jgi:hypothetical protein
MRLKHFALFFVLSSLLAVIPSALAGVHPCEATFEAKINGKSSYIGTYLNGITLKEPGLSGSTFTVEVWIENVADMYAYEFNLTWSDSSAIGGPYIVLVDYSYNTSEYWAAAIVVKPDADFALHNLGNPATLWYQQVASAMAPSAGFTGSAKLVTLTFKILNDPVWVDNQYKIEICFNFDYMKVSDSCSTSKDICTPLGGLLRLLAVQPSIYMVPNHEENSALPGKFTKTVWVANVTRMHSLCFGLVWNTGEYVGAWNPLDPYYDYAWPQVKVEKIEILVTEPLAWSDIEWGPKTDVVVGGGKVHVDWWLWVGFELKDPPYANLLNGTFPVVRITFEKQDPWYCGRQPYYYFDQPHEVFTKPCITDFWFDEGAIDVLCCTKQDISFGTDMSPNGGDTRDPGDYSMVGWAVYFDYLQGKCTVDFVCNIYTFTAIPGDLNLDGKVDITDVMMEASYYGLPLGTYPNMYYDLNGDGFIDIYDIVIVAKNFGRTSP